MKTRVFAFCVVVFLFCGIAYAGLYDGFAGFKEIEGELKDALLSGHPNELIDNGILPENLLNLYIVDKSLKFYGFSPESSNSSDLTSQFKQIDFNKAYRNELIGNIHNFIAVLEGKSFLLCDILVTENSLKLLGFRRTTEGLDLSQIINSENNQIFLTPNTIFTKNKNGYLLNRRSSERATRSSEQKSQEISQDELLRILQDEHSNLQSDIEEQSPSAQSKVRSKLSGSIDCPSVDNCRILGIEGSLQMLDKWCWTAATKTIASFYGWGIKACDIAYYGLKYNGTTYNDCYNAGSNNCSEFTRIQFTEQSKTISCNQGGNTYLIFESLTDYYGSINIYRCAESACLKNLTKMREYLSQGRPLYVARNLSSDSAHAYTVGGYYKSSGDYYVIAWDPWINTEWWWFGWNTEWTDLKIDSIDVGGWGTFWQYGSPLSNGVSNSGSLSQGESRFYKINVNSSYSTIQVDLTNLSSDLDLYVRKGRIPNKERGDYDKSSTNGGTTSDTCTLDNTGTNDWYIGVYGYSTGNFTVKATLSSGGGTGGTTYRGNVEDKKYSYQPNGTYYQSTAYGTHKGILSGPYGTDFDLYLWKWNTWTSTWALVGKGTGSSSTETVLVTDIAGEYIWGVYAYSGSGSYSLWISHP